MSFFNHLTPEEVWCWQWPQYPYAHTFSDNYGNQVSELSIPLSQWDSRAFFLDSDFYI